MSEVAGAGVMVRFDRFVTLVAVVGLVVAACGDSSAASAPNDDPEPTITIKDFSFGEPISVAVGDTVVVTNEDGLTHTWTSKDGLFNAGGIVPGGSFQITFEEPGEYAFFCSIHPSMTGTISVSG